MVKTRLFIVILSIIAGASLAADLKTRPRINTIPDGAVVPLFNNVTGMYQLTGTTIKQVISTTPQSSTIPFSLPSHAGVWSAGSITSNGNGTVTVAANTASFYADANKTTLQTFTIAGGVVSLTDQKANYIVADHNSNIFVALTDPALVDYVRYLPYAEVYRNGNNVHVQISPIFGNGEIEANHDRISKTNRYARETGLDAISVNEYLEITISGGVVWVINKPYTIPASSTSSRGFFEYHNAGIWSSTSALNPKINNSQYDNGTNLVTLTDGYWNINYIYRGIEDQDHVYVVLSSGEYATAELAKSAGIIGDVPEMVTSHAMLVGRVIAQKGATSNFVIESSFTNTFAGASPVSTHNNLSGLQGGTDGEYYHLTAGQHTVATTAATGTNDGYLSALDHALFSAKVATTDPRLSDARTPLAHTQAASTITGLAPVAIFGTYTSLTGKPVIPGPVCSPTGPMDGADGSKIYLGDGLPDSGLGLETDVYINRTTSNYYQKVSGVWTLQGNLLGGTGPANTLAIGTVTTVEPTTPASATITGTSPNQTLNLSIPQGLQGTNATVTQEASIGAINQVGGPAIDRQPLAPQDDSTVFDRQRDIGGNVRWFRAASGLMAFQDVAGLAYVTVNPTTQAIEGRDTANRLRLSISRQGTITTYHTDGTTPVFQLYSTGKSPNYEPPAGAPAVDGYCWKSTTDKVRSWGPCGTGGGSPGTPDKSLQYNNGGSFAGSGFAHYTSTGTVFTGTLVIR